MQKPLDLSYLVNEAIWNKTINLFKKENQKKKILNRYIMYVIQFWINHRFKDRVL
jgi:hypothetical protein